MNVVQKLCLIAGVVFAAGPLLAEDAPAPSPAPKGSETRAAQEQDRFKKHKEEMVSHMDEEITRIEARLAAVQQMKTCVTAAASNKDIEICHLEQRKQEQDARIKELKKK